MVMEWIVDSSLMMNSRAVGLKLPVLIASAEGSIQLDLGVHFAGVEVAGIEIIAQLPRPRSLGLDVTRQIVLVRRRSQRERVELLGLDFRAAQPDPLAREILEIGRPVELNLSKIHQLLFIIYLINQRNIIY